MNPTAEQQTNMNTNKIREALEKMSYAMATLKDFYRERNMTGDMRMCDDRMKNAKEALAELDKASAEPVAWMWKQLMHGYMGGWHFKCETYNPMNNAHVKPDDIKDLIPLYTHPPKPEQPRVDQQFIDIIDELMKLQDIYTRSQTGIVTKEERNYLNLQWGEIWPEVRRLRSELNTKPTPESAEPVACDPYLKELGDALAPMAKEMQEAKEFLATTHPPKPEQPRVVLTAKEITDAAIECFQLGPEDEDAALRFAMRIEDLAPAAGLTVEEAMGVFIQFDKECCNEDTYEEQPLTQYGIDQLRARLTAALNAKNTKP